MARMRFGIVMAPPKRCGRRAALEHDTDVPIRLLTFDEPLNVTPVRSLERTSQGERAANGRT